MKMEINGDFVPAAKECVELEELDDGCILYDTGKDEVHSLNITAAFIWSCCDGKHSIKEIATIVEKCFEPGSKLVLEDVLIIVKDFIKKELLKL